MLEIPASRLALNSRPTGSPEPQNSPGPRTVPIVVSLALWRSPILELRPTGSGDDSRLCAPMATRLGLPSARRPWA
jgi:hypothetical protein